MARACSTAWSSAARRRCSTRRALLRWNSDKSYLAELGRRGRADRRRRAPSTALDEAGAGRRARRDSATELVVKPLVSASADDTYRLGAGDAVPAQRPRPADAGPAVHAVDRDEGEYSLMLFGGALQPLHRQAPQGAATSASSPHLGGTETPCAPPPGAIALAQAALAAAPAPRDLCPGRHGRRRRRRAPDHGAGADRAGAVAPARARQGRGIRRGDRFSDRPAARANSHWRIAEVRLGGGIAVEPLDVDPRDQRVERQRRSAPPPPRAPAQKMARG